MTPLLLFPLGLAALAALAIPLIIHLRRRTEEVPVDFAAMRWLDALPRPRRRLRFDELLLLALRLVLIALLALMLARPAVLGWEDDSARVLVAPGVDPAAAREIAGEEAQMQWIAPGFPSLENPTPAPAPVSSLIRQFDAELPPAAALTIIVPQVLDGVDADRLRLTREVKWRIVESEETAARIQAVPGPALSVRYDQGGRAAVRYFRAAAQAWSEKPAFDAASGDVLPPSDHVLIWLAAGRVPPEVLDWVDEGGTALLGVGAEVAMPDATTALWRDAAGDTLVEGGALGAGRLLRFTRPLTPADMPELLEADFAARLRDLVAPPARAPARVSATAFAPTTAVRRFALPPRELTAWLAVLIATAFLAERLLATRRRRIAA